MKQTFFLLLIIAILFLEITLPLQAQTCRADDGNDNISWYADNTSVAGLAISNAESDLALNKCNEEIVLPNSFLDMNVNDSQAELQVVSFDWKSDILSKTINLKATKGTKNIFIDWGNGKIDTLSGLGDEIVTASVNYGRADTNYLARIITNASLCELSYLDVSHAQLNSIDVTQATKLTELNVANNLLSDPVNIDNCTLLEFFNCSNNYTGPFMLFSENTSLRELYLDNNWISVLMLEDLPLLTTLSCDSNGLSALYFFSEMPALKTLSANFNHLAWNGGALEYMLFSFVPNLTTLDISNNSLTGVDFSSLTKLKNLNCANSHIKNLNLSALTALDSLDCSNNNMPLSVLEPLWKNKSITKFKILSPQTVCDTVEFHEVDLSGEMSFGNPSATTVWSLKTATGASAEGRYTFEDGKLNFLKGGSYIMRLQNDSVRSGVTAEGDELIVINNYHVKGLERIAFTWKGSLDTKKIQINLSGSATIDWGNGVTSVASGWNYYNSPAYGREDTTYTVAITGNTATSIFSYLSLSEDMNTTRGVTSIDVSEALNLTELNCWNNALTSLDVSGLTKLNVLRCHYNQLETLTLAGNVNMDELTCSNNKLTSLEVSDMTKMRILTARNNRLSSLDITGLTKLEKLYAEENAMPLSVLYPIWMNKVIPSGFGYTKNINDQLIYDTVYIRNGIDLNGENAFGTPPAYTKVEVLSLDYAHVHSGYHWDAVAGILTFYRGGDYKVIMTNDNVRSGNSIDGAELRVTMQYHVIVLSPDLNGILYVKTFAEGKGDGSSWTNAMGSLSDALKYCRENNGAHNVKAIYVGSGIYKPKYNPAQYGLDTTGTVGGMLAGDKTFLLPPNVKIYGGFKATNPEATPEERTWLTAYKKKSALSGAANMPQSPTILSGVLNATDTAYHVVMLVDSNQIVKNTYLLDGFKITNGSAKGDSSLRIQDRRLYRNAGGGFFARSSDSIRLIMQNNQFVGNSACYGGGMALSNGCHVIIANQFLDNSAVAYGGGLYVESGSHVISNNQIIENSAAMGGGGMTVTGPDVLVLQNILSGNRAVSTVSAWGGGICSFESKLLNNTLYNNYAQSNNQENTLGQEIYSDGTSQIYNNIICNTSRDTALYINDNTTLIKNNLLSDKSLVGNVDEGKVGSNIFATDPLFVGTDTFNFNLKVASPAINTADTGLFRLLAGYEAKDAHDGCDSARLSGRQLDVGAREYQGIIADSIRFTVDSILLWRSNTQTLQLNWHPDDVTDKSLVWQSLNPDVATVNADGKVSALSEGFARIVATSPSLKTDTCVIEVRCKDINDITITVDDIAAQIYTGDPITPLPVVTDDTTVLEKERDYILTYSNNTNPGTATIAISGIGIYSGTRDKTFVILSNDTTLSALTANPATLKPTFASNTFVYYDTVSYATTTVNIAATATCPNAVVADTGSKTLNVGDNSFNIVVTAEANTYSGTYTVSIYRQSNDATLSALEVSVGTLNPSFTPTTTDYNVTVGDNVTEFEIGATANHDNATVSGAGIKSLPSGPHRFEITVTAEDESYSQTYIVNLYRNCPPNMRDQDGNSYGVALIGCNCWTTSNLKSILYYDGTPVTFAEGYYADSSPDTTSHIATFGRLYDWPSASRGEQPDANGYIQGVCPAGWALPTVADFECLLPLGSEALRENDPSFWLNDHTATNSSGFSAVPAGYYEANTNSFLHLLGEGYLWIGAPITTHTAKACKFLFGCPETTLVSFPTGNGASVRCVRIEN